MEKLEFLLWLASGWLCSGMVPLVLAVVACIDISRRREPWWWFVVVFVAPVVGPLAYFGVTRFGPRSDSRGTPRERRRQAARRLAELETQLAHWRGPAVVAESGEELLLLSRFAEAEARFREARTLGATPQDANLGLAESLIAQGRMADAIDPLRELLALDPDHAMGRAQVLLARCLDECDRGDEAEAALRRVLASRNVPEARVRLARRLVLAGWRDEGLALVNDLIAEERHLSQPLRRAQAPWTRAARALARGRTTLPESLRRGGERGPSRWKLFVGVALLVVALALAAAVRVALWAMD